MKKYAGLLLIILLCVSAGFRAQAAPLFTVSPDENHILVAGVLRFGTEDESWNLLSDERHGSLHIKGVRVVSNRIVVDYDFIAKKVITFVAVPDETYAASGYVFGATVGTRNAAISITREQSIGGLISYQGKKWVVPDTGKRWDAYNKFTVAFSKEGILTIRHADIGENDFISLTSGSELRLAIHDSTPRSVQVVFYDKNNRKVTKPSEKMKVYLTRTRNPATMIDPLALKNDSGNIWIFGVFEK